MSMEKFLNGDRVYELWAKIKSALSAKQNVLTAEDGIRIEGDAIRVTTPVRGLTQAEYDGIPQEERKGLFVITDSNTALPEGGEVYSTEETRIGTWIDGKPLYRKAFFGITPATNTVSVLADLSDLSIDTVVSGEGMCDSTLQVGIVSIPYIREGVGIVSVGVSNDKTSLNIYTVNSTFQSKTFHYLLKYTKTTDQGVSA